MKEKESQTSVKAILRVHLCLVIKVSWKRQLISLNTRTANPSPQETWKQSGKHEEVNQAAVRIDGCGHLPKRRQCSSRPPMGPTQSSFFIWFSKREKNKSTLATYLVALPFPTLVILCFVSNQLLPFLPIVSKLRMSKKSAWKREWNKVST